MLNSILLSLFRNCAVDIDTVLHEKASEPLLSLRGVRLVRKPLYDGRRAEVDLRLPLKTRQYRLLCPTRSFLLIFRLAFFGQPAGRCLSEADPPPLDLQLRRKRLAYLGLRRLSHLAAFVWLRHDYLEGVSVGRSAFISAEGSRCFGRIASIPVLPVTRVQLLVLCVAHETKCVSAV